MSKGYNTRAYISGAPGAFAVIGTSDFGVTSGGTGPALTPSASGGSLATTTARVAVAWVTANGISLVTAETTASVTGATGSVSVAKPTTPTTTGAPIIGWLLYSSSGGAGTPLLNSAGTVQTQINLVTSQGTFKGFALATTTVVIQIYGTGAGEPAVDTSGIQPGLPLVAANSTSDYYAFVPNTGSQWKVQKSVQYMNSDALANPTGIVLSNIACTQPVYPGTAITSGTSQANWVVTAGSWMVLNGYLFQATVGGAVAATFIGFAAFNLTTGKTTTDGSVTWTSFGKAALLRFRFGNTSGTAATPVATAYELFQD